MTNVMTYKIYKYKPFKDGSGFVCRDIIIS